MKDPVLFALVVAAIVLAILLIVLAILVFYLAAYNINHPSLWGVLYSY